MDGFGLLIGHLIGDYIVQNDWMAKNKTNDLALPKYAIALYGSVQNGLLVYNESLKVSRIGHLACTIHCLLYTLAVWLCSFWWMPWWGLVICFAVHWPIDRFRLAAWWMKNISGQTAFATGPLSPWSIILVDNVWHLLTLFLIALAAR